MAAGEWVVAIDVGGTTLKGAVVDRFGRARLSERLATAGGEPERVIEFARRLSVRGDGAPAAVGLAVPGLVDDEGRTVLEASNLGWRDVPIGALAEDGLGVPVAVCHDGRAGAVAEGLLGAARGCRDYLLITLGTGVGAAMVLEGRPYTGTHGLAGELGHVAVAPDGPVCGCGASGCLEAVASAGHIARRYEVLSGSSVSAEDVCRRAVRGDELAQRVWGEAVDALALGIANYVTLLDPERVVIGGGMAAAGAALFDPLRARVSQLVRFAPPPPIVAAVMGEEAGQVGAAIQAWRAAGATESELAGWHASVQ